MFATSVRFLAQKVQVKSNDKVPSTKVIQYGQQWSGRLTEIVKEHGPLTIASFWEHAQRTGLRSKSQMKHILRWMKDQGDIKLLCNHTGDRRSPTSREFLYVYVDPSRRQVESDAENIIQRNKNHLSNLSDENQTQR